MIETIISNNCSGGAILHELGMEFKTPTINLQILPEEYPKYCQNFRKYMEEDLKEYKDISEEHKTYLYKMFGGVPDMPFGIISDVMVCFQHYGTFEEAKQKWDERKAKIDYDHIGFIFHARGPEYRNEAEEFMKLDIPNKLVLAQDFEIKGAANFAGEAFSAINGKVLITQIYDWREYVKNQNECSI